MLKKTKEYGNFGNFIEDSGGNAVKVSAPPDKVDLNKDLENDLE